MSYHVKEFFDPATYTLTYVVDDPRTNDAVIIDSVLDYDPAASQISFESVNTVIDYVDAQKLEIKAILETHAHADHLSAAQLLKKRYPAAILGIGKNITQVQGVFKKVFGLEELLLDGSQFDLLIEENKSYKFGSIELKAIFTPGHTPACASYLIGDALFTGDAVFMPDYGTGRCDFPSGSAEDLWNSVQKIYALPEDTKIYVGHDYQPGGRELAFVTTVKEERENNIQLNINTKKEDFIKFRQARDATLKAPRLLLPSVQVNIDGGKVPSFLKIPITGKK